MSMLILNGDARRIPLANASVHVCVTSPPYWHIRDYGVSGQIGLEATHLEYIDTLVAVFREVWRVLRSHSKERNMNSVFVLDTKKGGYIQ